ncbi:MAG TPA: hypothetical protein VD794_16370, partial [Flavisolibacter sp.]|nr:hypothetical protein [Flavisolibacter sp.]
MSNIYNGDPSLKEPILISTIPYNPASFSGLTGTISANGLFSLLWTIVPDKPQLSLYNIHFSVRFGQNLPGYEWPYGDNINANNYTIVSNFTDLLGTDYLNNRIYYPVVLKNNTASPVTFWCYMKA